LHPKLLDFCKRINEIDNTQILIFTNLSADVSLYKELLNINCLLDISWHKTNKLTTKQFINKSIKLLKIRKSNINISLMYE
jgi:hypothetical protein